MKLVTAIIKPFKLDEVREALSERGVQGMDCYRTEGVRPAERAIPSFTVVQNTSSIFFTPRSIIEVAVSSVRVDEVVETIQNAANTESIGDGKIFVQDLQR